LGLRKDEELHIYEGRQFCKKGIFLGFEQKEEKTKFLVFFLFGFVVKNVSISVLNRLQYLVALEGRMHEGVNGYISKG
jgi:hypothetical protein